MSSRHREAAAGESSPPEETEERPTLPPPGNTMLRRANCTVEQLPCVQPGDELPRLTKKLLPLTTHCGQFAVGSSFDAQFVARLIREGFMPLCEVLY